MKITKLTHWHASSTGYRLPLRTCPASISSSNITCIRMYNYVKCYATSEHQRFPHYFKQRPISREAKCNSYMLKVSETSQCWVEKCVCVCVLIDSKPQSSTCLGVFVVAAVGDL